MIDDTNERVCRFRLRDGAVTPRVGAVIPGGRIVDLSVVGIGMRSHVGIASRMFKALADEGINIQMISTSEIKVSVLVAAEYTELAVRALHTAYELDAA